MLIFAQMVSIYFFSGAIFVSQCYFCHGCVSVAMDKFGPSSEMTKDDASVSSWYAAAD